MTADLKAKFTLREVAEFLDGAAPLDGVWFGEHHPDHGRSDFWWRKHLRAALAALGEGEAGAQWKLQRWAMAKGSDGNRWSVYMDHNDTGEWVKWAHVQQALLVSRILATRQASEGFVVVPAEPTREMVAAGTLGGILTHNQASASYQAQVAAAPKPADGGGDNKFDSPTAQEGT